MIVCPNCGRENADNFNFCLDCGYDLKTYRESVGSEDGGAPPPVGGSTPPAPTPAPLAHGASTESLSTSEVRELAASASNPGDQPVAAPDSSTLETAASMSAVAPPSAPAPITAPVPVVTPAPEPALTPSDTAPQALDEIDAAVPTCPSCQTPNPSGNKFCGSCGSAMDGTAKPAAAAAAAAPAGDVAAGRTMFMHATDLASVKPELKCKLITIDQSGQEGMTFSLRSGETACGRVNGIVLFFDDPYVSPSHCNFEFVGEKLKVTDADSLNGVYTRIQGEHALEDGDFLRIGRQLFRFEPLAAAAEQIKTPTDDDSKIWGSPNPGAFARLLQILEDGRTGEIRLLSGEACNLGREQGDIVFPTDGFISGRHCSFFQDGGVTKIKDLGSSNGTYMRLRGATEVGNGDFLLIGNQMLRVEIA